MNAARALALLRGLGVPLFTTVDASAALRGTVASASKTLARLGSVGLVIAVSRGVWALDPNVDPFLLPDLLTAPALSYVSLQTALYRHGAIEQIPAAIYVVTLGRPLRRRTALGTFSMHRIPPELFGGFELTSSGTKLATVEKALVDVAYLSGSRGRLFASLPELELPREFDRATARHWIARIPNARMRRSAEMRFDAWVRLATRRQ